LILFLPFVASACVPSLARNPLEIFSIFRYFSSTSTPPPTLSYNGSPYTFTQGLAITTVNPSVSGSISKCISSPSLPSGLTIDNITCAISGTPSANQTLTEYSITASNRTGSATAKIGITINNEAPQNLSYGSTSYVFSDGFPITTLNPTVSGTVTSCSSSGGLPTGLTLSSTCSLSGTPTVIQVSSPYTITATNLYGSTSITINIQVIASPVVTLSVAGLQALDTLVVTETLNSPSAPVTITGPSVATGTIPVPSGVTYNFKVGTFSKSAGNTDKVCSIQEMQYGSTTIPITLNINCVNGVENGKGVSQSPLAKFDYRLYQGNVSLAKTANTLSIPGLAIFNGNLYYFDKSTNTGYVFSTSTMIESVLFLGTAVTPNATDLRHPVTDGTNLYFSDWPNSRILKFALNGTYIGSFPVGVVGASGLALDQANQILYITIRNSTIIKRLNLSNGSFLSDITGINDAEDITLLNGDLYVANHGGNNILKITTPSATPGVSVYAGTGTMGFSDGSLLGQSQFDKPHAITHDGTDLYVAEFGNNRVRRLDTKRGIVTTIAGDGANSGSMLVGAKASFSGSLTGIISNGNNFYLSDSQASLYKLGDNGIVGYWSLLADTLDRNSGGSAINNGTWIGTATYPANSGRNSTDSSASFDGTTQYISGTDTGLPSGTSARTMCSWFKTSSSAGGIILSYGTPMAGQASSLAVVTGTIGFSGWGGGVNAALVNFKYDTGLWTHLCSTYNGSLAKIYVNGHLLLEKNVTISTVLGTLRIGSQIDNNSRFTGYIADVRIYNRVLNEGEINELAQDAVSTNVGQSFNTGGTGLLSQYSFNAVSNNGIGQDSGPLAIVTNNVNGNLAASGKDGDASGSFRFNGSTQYLTAASLSGLPTTASPRTLCAWVNPDNLPSTSGLFLVANFGAAASSRSFGLFLDNPSGTQRVGLTGSNDDVIVNHTLPINTWSQLCGTYDGTTAKLYVGGVMIGSSTKTYDTGNSFFQIGAQIGPGQYFKGKIDEVSVYNSALSSGQIRQLATEVPAGLVAKYDFNGDANDQSGWGNDLSNTGAIYNATGGRFGTYDGAYSFSNARLNTTSNLGFPTGNSARTICAWFKASGTYAAFNGVVNVAGSDTFGINVSNETSANLYLSLGGYSSVSSFSQTSIWNFACSVDHGNNTQSFYYNGSYINGATQTLNTTNPVLYIGNLGAASNYNPFDGIIDEVRLYNRPLVASEIQALVQQPNKKIVETTNTFDGTMTRSSGLVAGTGANGIAKADNWCQAEFGSTYKSMIVDGTPNRRACTTAFCSTGVVENYNWVLRPNITYLRADGITPVMTVGWNGVFTTLSNGIGTAGEVWTGLDSTWTTLGTCTNWTSNSAGLSAPVGDSAGGSNFLHRYLQTCDRLTVNLYCVEQ